MHARTLFTVALFSGLRRAYTNVFAFNYSAAACTRIKGTRPPAPAPLRARRVSGGDRRRRFCLCVPVARTLIMSNTISDVPVPARAALKRETFEYRRRSPEGFNRISYLVLVDAFGPGRYNNGNNTKTNVAFSKRPSPVANSFSTPDFRSGN